MDEATSTICFRDEPWLLTYPLNTHTVLDYFARSPFWDPACNNAALRQRGVSLDQLTTMQGVEYILHEAFEPHLYLIRKQTRKSPTAANLLSVFYVLDGTAYQAPSIHAVLSTRLMRCIHNLDEAFAILSASRAAEMPRPASGEPAVTGRETDAAETVPEAPTGRRPGARVRMAPDEERVERLILGVLASQSMPRGGGCCRPTSCRPCWCPWPRRGRPDRRAAVWRIRKVAVMVHDMLGASAWLGEATIFTARHNRQCDSSPW